MGASSLCSTQPALQMEPSVSDLRGAQRGAAVPKASPSSHGLGIPTVLTSQM